MCYVLITNNSFVHSAWVGQTGSIIKAWFCGQSRSGFTYNCHLQIKVVLCFKVTRYSQDWILSFVTSESSYWVTIALSCPLLITKLVNSCRIWRSFRWNGFVLSAQRAKSLCWGCMRVTTEVPLQNLGASWVKVIFLRVTGKSRSTGWGRYWT